MSYYVQGVDASSIAAASSASQFDRSMSSQSAFQRYQYGGNFNGPSNSQAYAYNARTSNYGEGLNYKMGAASTSTTSTTNTANVTTSTLTVAFSFTNVLQWLTSPLVIQVLYYLVIGWSITLLLLTVLGKFSSGVSCWYAKNRWLRISISSWFYYLFTILIHIFVTDYTARLLLLILLVALPFFLACYCGESVKQCEKYEIKCKNTNDNAKQSHTDCAKIQQCEKGVSQIGDQETEQEVQAAVTANGSAAISGSSHKKIAIKIGNQCSGLGLMYESNKNGAVLGGGGILGGIKIRNSKRKTR